MLDQLLLAKYSMSNLNGVWFASGATHPITSDDFYSIIGVAQNYASIDELVVVISLMRELLCSGMVIDDDVIIYEWIWTQRTLDALNFKE